MRYRLFGGDATRQRAVEYARNKGWHWVLTLGEPGAPFDRFDLDPWGRRPGDSIRYSHAAVDEADDEMIT